MTTDNINQPAIYYVIQGRKLENDSSYIEHCFMDSNPAIARQRAFDYLEYYVQLLQQGKQLFFRDNEKLVTDKFSLNDLQNTTVSFAENNIGVDGIALFMVINEPINYMNIVDQKEDRYLLYAIKNLSENDIEKIKKGLIREYGYYKFMQIDTSKMEDEVELVSKSKKNGFKEHLIYTILQSPFEFKFADINTKRQQKFRNSIAYELKTLDLSKVVFASSLNYHLIAINIASLLNTKGGRVYLCKFYNHKISSIFSNETITQIKTIFRQEIQSKFKSNKHYLSLHFVKINTVLVPIIEVKLHMPKPCFYNNIENNSFYYRTSRGLQKFNDTEQIVNYLFHNYYINEDISDILESL